MAVNLTSTILNHISLGHILLMRFISVVFGIVIASTLAACSPFPRLPHIETTRGARVGYLVEGGNTPTHSHVGIFAFNVFVKKYDYNWNLKAEITSIVRRDIATAGFVPVDLQAQGMRYSDVKDLIRPADDKWVVPKDREAVLHRLRSDHRLKALIVLKEAQVLAAMECIGGPCTMRYADGPGLYTRGAFGYTEYSAVAAYDWNVFVLDSPADTAWGKPLRSIVRMPSARLHEFKSPANFDNLTESEFAPVHEAVLALVQEASAAAVKTLNPK